MRDILECGHRSTVANRGLTVNFSGWGNAVPSGRTGDPSWWAPEPGLWIAAFTTAITVRGPLPGNCEVMCSLLSLIRSITGSTTSARRFACCA